MPPKANVKKRNKPPPSVGFKTANGGVSRGRNIHSSIGAPLKKTPPLTVGIKTKPGHIKSVRVSTEPQDTAQLHESWSMSATAREAFKTSESAATRAERTVVVNTITPVAKPIEPAMEIRGETGDTLSLRMSDQLRQEPHVHQAPIEEVPVDPGFGVTTNEVVQIVKPVKKLTIPLKNRVAGILKQVGKIVFIPRTSEFYGFNGAEWLRFNSFSNTPNLAQLLARNNSAGGKNITGVSTLSGDTFSGNSIVATSVTCSTISANSLVTKGLTTATLTGTLALAQTIQSSVVNVNSIQTTQLNFNNINYNFIYGTNVTATHVITSTLLISNISTATFTGSLTFETLQVQNLITATLNAGTILVENLWTNTFTATLLDTILLLVGASDFTISNDLSLQNVYATAIQASNITFSQWITNTLSSNTIYTNVINGSTLFAENLVAESIVSSLGSVATLLTDAVATANLTTATFTSSTLQVQNIYGANGIQANSLVIPTYTGTTLNAASLVAENLRATIGSATLALVNNLSTSTFTANDTVVNYLNVAQLAATNLTLTTLNTSEIYTANSVFAETLAGTVVSAIRGNWTDVYTNVLTATIANTFNNISATITAGNVNTGTLVVNTGTFTVLEAYGFTNSGQLYAGTVWTDNLTVNALTSTMMTCSTLIAANLSASLLTASTVNCVTFWTDILGYNITATNFVGSTLEAENIYANALTATSFVGGTFTGTFQGYVRSFERVGYPSGLTISPNVEKTYVTSGQEGQASWGARIAGTSTETAKSAAINSNGDIVTTGYYNSSPVQIYNANGQYNISLPFSGGTYDIYVAKWNTRGQVEWGARVAGVSADYGQGIALNDGGDIVCSGYYNSSPLQIYNAGGTFSNISLPRSGGSSQNDAFVAKWNSIGTAEWAVRVSGNFNETGFGVAINNQGDIVFTGMYNSDPLYIYNKDGSTAFSLPFSGVLGDNVFIVKWNTSGFGQWASRIAGDFAILFATGIGLNNLGDIVVTGSYSDIIYIYDKGGTFSNNNISLQPLSGNYEAYIVKWNSIGTGQWAAAVSNINNDDGYGIDVNDTGDIVATGVYSSSAARIYNAGGIDSSISLPNSGSDDAYIVKWNSSGTAQWATRVASVSSDIGRGININNVGYIVATGSYNNAVQIYNAGGTVPAISLPFSGFTDAFIAKWNSNGITQWGASIAGVDDDIGYGVGINDVEDIVVCGEYQSSPLQIYNAGGTFSNISLPFSGGSDAFIVKYSNQQFSTGLANPATDGQIKKIYSTSPEVLINPISPINYLDQTVQLLNGESVEMIWDAQQANWVVLNLTGTLV